MSSKSEPKVVIAGDKVMFRVDVECNSINDDCGAKKAIKHAMEDVNITTETVLSCVKPGNTANFDQEQAFHLRKLENGDSLAPIFQQDATNNVALSSDEPLNLGKANFLASRKETVTPEQLKSKRIDQFPKKMNKEALMRFGLYQENANDAQDTEDANKESNNSSEPSSTLDAAHSTQKYTGNPFQDTFKPTNPFIKQTETRIGYPSSPTNVVQPPQNHHDSRFKSVGTDTDEQMSTTSDDFDKEDEKFEFWLDPQRLRSVPALKQTISNLSEPCSPPNTFFGKLHQNSPLAYTGCEESSMPKGSLRSWEDFLHIRMQNVEKPLNNPREVKVKASDEVLENEKMMNSGLLMEKRYKEKAFKEALEKRKLMEEVKAWEKPQENYEFPTSKEDLSKAKEVKELKDSRLSLEVPQIQAFSPISGKEKGINSHRQDSLASHNKVTTPSKSNDYTLAYRKDSPPLVSKDCLSSHSQISLPQSKASLPLRSLDSLPSNNKDSLPLNTKDSVSLNTKDSLSLNTKDSVSLNTRDSLPSTNEDSLSSTNEDSLSSTNEDSPPNEDSTPSPSQHSFPLNTKNSSSHNIDSSPLPNKDSSPLPNEDSSPLPNEDSSPLPNEDSSPLPNEDSSPSPNEDSPPSPKEDYPPSSKEDSSHNKDSPLPLPDKESPLLSTPHTPLHIKDSMKNFASPCGNDSSSHGHNSTPLHGLNSTPLHGHNSTPLHGQNSTPSHDKEHSYSKYSSPVDEATTTTTRCLKPFNGPQCNNNNSNAADKSKAPTQQEEQTLDQSNITEPYDPEFPAMTTPLPATELNANNLDMIRDMPSARASHMYKWLYSQTLNDNDYEVKAMEVLPEYSLIVYSDGDEDMDIEVQEEHKEQQEQQKVTKSKSTENMEALIDCFQSLKLNVAIPECCLTDSVFLVDKPLSAVSRNCKLPSMPLEDICPVNEYLKIRVTHVYTPFQFWFNFVDRIYDTSVLLEIQAEMGKFYSDNTSDYVNALPRCLLQADYLCAIQLEEGWRRARITAAPSHDVNIVTIYYLDYGYGDDVSASELRYLPNHFADRPELAIRGTLSYIHPLGPHWSPDSMQQFQRLTINKEMFAHIIELDLKERIVFLRISMNQDFVPSVNKLLVDANLAGRSQHYDLEKVKNNFGIRHRYLRERLPSHEMLETRVFPILDEQFEVAFDGIIYSPAFGKFKVPRLTSSYASLRQALVTWMPAYRLEMEHWASLYNGAKDKLSVEQSEAREAWLLRKEGETEKERNESISEHIEKMEILQMERAAKEGKGLQEEVTL